MEEIKYIRVGTSYFKKVKAPTISGDFNEVLVPWSIETIRQDYGKDYLANVPKFDGFTCIPEPVYTYSYRRAVVEGHLIDFDPPYVFKTCLSENGIVWNKGDQVTNKCFAYLRIMDEPIKLNSSICGSVFYWF